MRAAIGESGPRSLDRTPSPVIAAGLASMICGGLVLAAMVRTGDLRGFFLAWNSWDALLQPVRLYHGIGRWFLQLREEPSTVVFLGLFTLFLFLGYFMFHAMGRAVREGDNPSGPGE